MKSPLNRSIIDNKQQKMDPSLTKSDGIINAAFAINVDKRAIS